MFLARGTLGKVRSAFLLSSLLLICPAAVAGARSVTTRIFWVQTTSGWQQLHLPLLGATPRIRLYGSVPSSLAGSGTARILKTLDRHVVPEDLQLFGSPRHLGVVNIVMLPLPSGTLGYFDESDVVMPHARGTPLHSNSANVLYIRPPQLMPDRGYMSDFYEVVAHELQHLIDFRLRMVDRNLPREEVWLNEGLSFFAQLANGYWTPRDKMKVLAAAANPNWQISSMNWQYPYPGEQARAAYGRAGLFVAFLASRYGCGFVRQLEIQPRTGLAAIDALLRQDHSNVRQAFADWSLAMYAPGSRDRRFETWLHGYQIRPRTTGASSTTSRGRTGATSQRFALAPWETTYVRFSAAAPGTLLVHASAARRGLKAALVAEDSDSPAATRSFWMYPAGRSDLVAQVPGFGRKYDSATVVVSNVGGDLASCGPGTTNPVRVWAVMMHGRGAEGSRDQRLSMSRAPTRYRPSRDSEVPAGTANCRT